MILLLGKDDLAVFSVVIFGAVIGSFIGSLSYRLAYNVPILKPLGSFCPKCSTQIQWFYNIPILSYFILKAKCAYCKEPISFLYLLSEVFGVVICLVLYFKFSFSYSFFIYGFIFFLLLLLSVIDIYIQQVPDYLLLLLLVTTLFVPNISYESMLLFVGGFVLLEFVVTFYIQNIKSRFTKDTTLTTQKALGEGDIPVIATIGAILGFKYTFIAIFLSAIFGIISLIFISTKSSNIQIPFIPYLFLGSLCVFGAYDILIGIL